MCCKVINAINQIFIDGEVLPMDGLFSSVFLSSSHFIVSLVSLILGESV